ncbi:MAG: hypothetical protein ACUVWA_13575, partial [Candidatus Oleimicrobiaceae bacterium]
NYIHGIIVITTTNAPAPAPVSASASVGQALCLPLWAGQPQMGNHNRGNHKGCPYGGGHNWCVQIAHDGGIHT